MGIRIFLYLFLSPILFFSADAQSTDQLTGGWHCKRADSVTISGEALSASEQPLNSWIPAIVPGTVLGTLIDNRQMPDPFFGMNNERIPDIYHIGSGYYTYWFVKDFSESKPGAGDHVWVQFRGINYSADIFLNGHKLNTSRPRGMFLRFEYDITAFLKTNGHNRLAVIVYPPDPAGNPNGGQGGDGEIARNLTHQYVAGWDWIQPVRDRNTGIWDEVRIRKTGSVRLKDPHVITHVPGIRQPEDSLQLPATIEVSTELDNPGESAVNGILECRMDGQTVTRSVTLPAHQHKEITLPLLSLAHPKLWWPNGYGAQPLYPLIIRFKNASRQQTDADTLSIGVRELRSVWNEHTRSMQLSINGQKIFIKGGNWIVSDELLRFSAARYDAEIRFHRDMNLNLIRVWGGALTERPAFYDACDRYGLLVWQDFWNSGDCNGRWTDPDKKEDQWVRRTYPDDHALFLTAAADQIKMIRNHASLALWCGGNEITPSEDILRPLKDSILARLDGTRPFIDYSNSDSISYNSIGGNGDGPYGIQPVQRFFNDRTFPFNSEVGSVGVGDYTSLARFLPTPNLEAFPQGKAVDSVWRYHKYIDYGNYPNAYGEPRTTLDFAAKAQLLNYDQYRALAEGFTSHMWDWYTGFVIWKTQNPWTALRGQMYDYYLDPNACLYGLRTGSKALHVFFNAGDSMVMIANNGFHTARDLMLDVRICDMDGKEKIITEVFNEIGPTNIRKYLSVASAIRQAAAARGCFLSLRLLNTRKETVDENIYWMSDSSGKYSGLMQFKAPQITATATPAGKGKWLVTLNNPVGGPVSFFNRISLIDADTRQRILPAFYSDNYVSVMPGRSKTIVLESPDDKPGAGRMISIEGWHAPEIMVKIVYTIN